MRADLLLTLGRAAHELRMQVLQEARRARRSHAEIAGDIHRTVEEVDALLGGEQHLTFELAVEILMVLGQRIGFYAAEEVWTCPAEGETGQVLGTNNTSEIANLESDEDDLYESN